MSKRNTTKFWTDGICYAVTEKMKKFYERSGKADFARLLLIEAMENEGINCTEERARLGGKSE